jgi:hypothetical protein
VLRPNSTTFSLLMTPEPLGKLKDLMDSRWPGRRVACANVMPAILPVEPGSLGTIRSQLASIYSSPTRLSWGFGGSGLP